MNTATIGHKHTDVDDVLNWEDEEEAAVVMSAVWTGSRSRLRRGKETPKHRRARRRRARAR